MWRSAVIVCGLWSKPLQFWLERRKRIKLGLVASQHPRFGFQLFAGNLMLHDFALLLDELLVHAVACVSAVIQRRFPNRQRKHSSKLKAKKTYRIVIGMSALIGEREEAFGSASFHNLRYCQEGRRQRSVKQLIHKRGIRLLGKKLDLIYPDRLQGRSSFLFPNRSIALARSVSLPEIIIFRGAVGCEHHTWLRSEEHTSEL